MMIFILLLNVDGGCSLGWPLWKTTDTRLSAGCGTPDKIDVARDASDWRRCFEDGGILGGCSLGPIRPLNEQDCPLDAEPPRIWMRWLGACGKAASCGEGKDGRKVFGATPLFQPKQFHHEISDQEVLGLGTQLAVGAGRMVGKAVFARVPHGPNDQHSPAFFEQEARTKASGFLQQ